MVCWGLLMLITITDICHNRHNRWWRTLFQAGVIFTILREREIFAYFGQFWLFCREYTLAHILFSGLNGGVVYQA